MVDTNESKKAESLWQTVCLSSASYDGLIFSLSIPCDYYRSIHLYSDQSYSCHPMERALA